MFSKMYREGMENFWKFGYGFMYSSWEQIGVERSSENVWCNYKIILIQARM
jgi:hypothetical protein